MDARRFFLDNRIHLGLFLNACLIFLCLILLNSYFFPLNNFILFLAVIVPSIIILSFFVFPETLKYKKYKYDYKDLNKKSDILHLLIQEKEVESLIFNNSINPVVITDADNNIIKVNESYLEMTGFCVRDLKGRRPNCLTTKLNSTEVYNDLWHKLNASNHWEGILNGSHKIGGEFSKKVRVKLIKDDSHNILNYLYMFYSIDEVYADFDKHKKMAMYDELTGIPNRNLFLDRMQVCIDDDTRIGSTSAIMFLDLDDFKIINDTSGHDYGDIVLKTTAKRIQGALRLNDTVARLGGDEFAIILRNIKGRVNAGKIAENIIKEIEKPIIIKNNKFHVSVSIGISITPSDSSSVSDALKYSDLAMYRAKHNGKGSFEYFNDEIKNNFQKQDRLKSDITEAIKNNEFEIHYLPQLNTKNNKIYCVEGLIRWSKDSLIINPQEFMPIAEKNGKVYDLDIYALKKADEHINFIKEITGKDIDISINISCATIKKLTEECDVLLDIENPSSIHLEVSEASISNNHKLISKGLQKLSDIGFLITIDDFGSGNASLNNIIDLPISSIKIDQRITRNINKNINSTMIINFINILGSSLSANVVAKGVESKRSVEELKNLGINNVQGFFISRPLSINALVDFLDKKQ